jgi:hypothetical protein
MATGRERRRLEGHQSGVYSLAFSPDGRSLASGSHDTTALLWDVLGVALPQGRHAPTLQETEAAWTGLRDSDAAKAFQSMGILAAAPRQTVSVLKERLHPVAPADPRVVKQLIDDLDSDHFETRQSATAELEQLDTLAQEQLRKALGSSPSPEARRRLEGLLQKLEETVPSAEVRRSLRAVELLERLGTPDARQVLTALAAGATVARVTQQARAALERLKSLRSE